VQRGEKAEQGRGVGPEIGPGVERDQQSDRKHEQREEQPELIGIELKPKLDIGDVAGRELGLGVERLQPAARDGVGAVVRVVAGCTGVMRVVVIRVVVVHLDLVGRVEGAGADTGMHAPGFGRREGDDVVETATAARLLGGGLAGRRLGAMPKRLFAGFGVMGLVMALLGGPVGRGNVEQVGAVGVEEQPDGEQADGRPGDGERDPRGDRPAWRQHREQTEGHGGEDRPEQQ